MAFHWNAIFYFAFLFKLALMPRMKIKEKKRTYILAFGIVSAISVMLIGAIDQLGYVFSGPYIVKGGVLVIEQARPNSTVFIDNKNLTTTDQDGVAIIKGIAIGSHDVLVSHEDAWPWTLPFTSYRDTTTTLIPIQVARESQGTTLSAENTPEELQYAQSSFTAYTEPSSSNPMERDNTSVWVEGTDVYVRTIDEKTRVVLASLHPIRNIFWYPERTDAIVIASNNNVFALDIRQGDIQNFHPIYYGHSPEAVQNEQDTKSIFVGDNGKYFAVAIW